MFRTFAWLTVVLCVGCCGDATNPADSAATMQVGRIQSGSMAERFYGPHWMITCEDCGFVFRVGVDYPPHDEQVTCLNCGCQQNIPSDAPRAGMAVDIVARDFQVYPPRRFEVIAFRDGTNPERVQIKRVVGLPGEHVGIRQGDLWIDDQRVVKTPEQFNAISQVVHQSKHWPSSTTHPWPWQLAESPAWSRRADQIRFEPGRSNAGGNRREDYQWLTILHYDFLVGTPSPRESPVLDSLAYNQGLSRQLNRVHDTSISATVRLTGQSRFAMEAWIDERVLVAELDASAQKATLRIEGAAELEKQDKLTVDDQPVRVELGTCEGRSWLRIGRRPPLVLTQSKAQGAEFPEEYRRWFLGGAGGKLEVHDVEISRDVYYLNPLNRDDPWQADHPLAGDEFFVLGDNAAGSIDSRHYGAIKLENIIGVVETPKSGS